MYQNTTIIGNVGKDPEMRYTAEGKAVCDFSVAVNKTRNVNGQKTTNTTWFKVTCWEKQAETVIQYVKKGMLVQVVGEIKASAYVAGDGTSKASLDLTAHNVLFLSRADDNASEGASNGAYSGGDSDPLGEFEDAQREFRAANASTPMSRGLDSYQQSTPPPATPPAAPARNVNLAGSFRKQQS